jgi:hypothetical protein
VKLLEVTCEVTPPSYVRIATVAILLAAIVVRPSAPRPSVSRTKNRLIMTIASDRAQVTIPGDVERSAGYFAGADAVYDRRNKEEVAKLTNLPQRVSSSIQIVLGIVASLDRIDCRAQRVFFFWGASHHNDDHRREQDYACPQTTPTSLLSGLRLPDEIFSCQSNH